MSSKIFSSSAMALRTRRRTRPSEDRSSKITTRITRWATMEMWMLSRSPSWKRIENSFSPISRARPSVAATLPAVSEASDVVSSVCRSPTAAICWPFLSTRKTTFAFASEAQPLQRVLDLLELLVVEDEVGQRHGLTDSPVETYSNSIRRRPFYSSRRFSSDRAIVTSSAYSMSPPTGRPNAMRVTRTPVAFSRRAR